MVNPGYSNNAVGIGMRIHNSPHRKRYLIILGSIILLILGSLVAFSVRQQKKLNAVINYEQCASLAAHDRTARMIESGCQLTDGRVFIPPVD